MREAVAEQPREFTTDDVRLMYALDLSKQHVLSGVARFLGIHLTTEANTTGRDYWVATPRVGPAFTGTMLEVAAYVRGYGSMWLQALDEKRRLIFAVNETILAADR